MTSQRWTRIRPPISPLPHHLHLPVSPGPQQTGCQVALPALPKVLPLIPLPPSALFTHTHTNTHTHRQCSLIHANYIPPIKPYIYSFIPSTVCLFGPFTIPSDPKKTNSVFSDPLDACYNSTLPPPLYPDHPWQPSSFCRQRE